MSLFDRPNKQSEEDPYSLPANGSSYDSSYYANNGTLLKRSTIREPKPPKLPPRDFGKYKSTNAKNDGKKTINKNKFEIPTPDYSQKEDFYTISEKNMKKIPFLQRGNPGFILFDDIVDVLSRPILLTLSATAMYYRRGPVLLWNARPGHFIPD